MRWKVAALVAGVLIGGVLGAATIHDPEPVDRRPYPVPTAVNYDYYCDEEEVP